jgi:hypothetical protein
MEHFDLEPMEGHTGENNRDRLSHERGNAMKLLSCL